MLTTPFLTQLDARAAIKGSRDPLGVQSIWSRFGRHVVGNLTTVTSSVRDFTVTLLGYYFAERVADEGGTEGDLATFLKWEQLAAYARARVNKERGFRGTERVWRRLNEESRVQLGIDVGAQILGNQKIYGLWGLYTIPAKASGLLEGDPTRLTAAARELVEREYLPLLAGAGQRDGRGIVDRLVGSSCTLDLRDGSKDAAVLRAVAKVLGKLRAGEVDFYRRHLLFGGLHDADPHRGTNGKQRVFAELLTETLREADWSLSPESIAALASRAKGQAGAGPDLAYRLERLRTCELLLAPAVAFFEHVLECAELRPKDVAERVSQSWGRVPRATIDLDATRAIEPELRGPGGDVDTGTRWLRLAQAFHAGNYEEALAVVLEQNAAVMKARSAAAPWATVKAGKLHVSFKDERLPRLPKGAELPLYWRHAYFVESLRSVADALRVSS
jgi:hypothetical protein